MTADALEARIARLEGVVEQVDRRLAAIDGDIRDLRARMDRQFFWILGLLIVSILAPVVLRASHG